MAFNFQTELETAVNWYAEMAANPATVDQARHSVKALQDKFPDDFGDLGQLVAQRMKERVNAADKSDAPATGIRKPLLGQPRGDSQGR